MIEVTAEPFDPAAALACFLRQAGQGAVVSFVGIVRQDEDVVRLHIDHYPGFTEREVGRIAEAVAARHALAAVEVIHRVGPMAPGDPIVFAATSAPHRRAAIAGLDELVDRLKTDAPFWKREDTEAGERWVEATDVDHLSRRRWATHG